MLWKTGELREGGMAVWKVANECHLSSTFSLNNLLSVCHMGCIYPLVLRFGQIVHKCVRRTHSRTVALYESEPPGPDRNNKQQMIHDGDGECIQQDHLSDLI